MQKETAKSWLIAVLGLTTVLVFGQNLSEKRLAKFYEENYWGVVRDNAELYNQLFHARGEISAAAAALEDADMAIDATLMISMKAVERLKECGRGGPQAAGPGFFHEAFVQHCCPCL